MMTLSAASASWLTSASIAARICASTSEPIRRMLSLTSATSWSKLLRVGCENTTCSRCSVVEGVRSSVMLGLLVSAEAAGHVVLGELVGGVREDGQRVVQLHKV